MSFLNELKQQAATLGALGVVDPEAVQRHARLAHGACRIARDYWSELAAQLNAIRPPSTAHYVIDGDRAWEGLHCSNFRVVPVSARSQTGEEFFASVLLAWQVGNGQDVRIEKAVPADIERVRAALRQACISPREEAVQDESAACGAATAFEFKAEVSASIRIQPLTENGQARLVFSNIEKLERVEALFPAVRMRTRALDEMGRWILGQSDRILKYATEVVRYAP